MLRINLTWLGSRLLVVLVIISIDSCKKQVDSGAGGSYVATIAFDFNLAYQKDTTITFSNTEAYRIWFENSTGESRCPNLNCAGCGPEVGTSGAVLRIYNIFKDSLVIQPFVSGCVIAYTDSTVTLVNLNDLNPRFNIKLGIKEMSPYPTANSYSGNGVNWAAYVGTFRIVKL